MRLSETGEKLWKSRLLLGPVVGQFRLCFTQRRKDSKENASFSLRFRGDLAHLRETYFQLTHYYLDRVSTVTR